MDPSSRCADCGHARAFHDLGTGHGVPAGEPYCDDRHARPCSCPRFVPEYEAPPTDRDRWERAQRALEATRRHLFLPAARYLLETGEAGASDAVLLLLQASGMHPTGTQALDIRRALELDALSKAYREALASFNAGWIRETHDALLDRAVRP